MTKRRLKLFGDCRAGFRKTTSFGVFSLISVTKIVLGLAGATGRIRPHLHNHLYCRYSLYRAWFHHPHRLKLKYALLSLHLVLIISLIFGSLMSLFIGVLDAQAATNTWSFGSSADYSFDSSNTEITSNTARLKMLQYPDDDSTRALWHMDETEGSSAADSSGNSNTATLQNSASFASARANNGLSLNGSNQYASAADSASLSLSSAMTLEAYIKFNSAFDNTDNAALSMLDKGNYKLYFDSSDGKLKFELEGNSAKSWAKAGEDNNSSWPGVVPNSAKVFGDYNSELYAGVGGVAGGAEVWKYSGSGTTWTKVGGDEISGSWNGSDYEDIASMVVFNSKLYVGLGSSANDAEVWSWNGTTWTKVGGDTLNSSWGVNYEYVYSLAADATYLYAGLGFTAGDAEVWRYNPATNSWGGLPIGGDGYSSSWSTNYESVYAMSVIGSNLYAGLGLTAGEAEVWSWNGTTWSQIGGDSVNSSWTAAGNYEIVYSLANDGTYLYAGLGASAGDAEVWKYDPTGNTWGGALIGGDGTGWANSAYEYVRGLVVVGGTLYASLGDTANDSEVWRFDNPGWTQIGGDGANSSWQYGKEYAYAGSFDGDLIVGTGGNTEDTEVWRYSDSSWSWIAGRDWNAWGAVQQGYVTAMSINNGKLYAAFGGSNKFATVWEYDGSTWSHVGGAGKNSGWDETIEYVWALASYNNKLYAGLGNSAGDADVYEYSGSTWSQIGGDALNSSWTASTYEQVKVMAVYQDNLYAGIGSGSAEGEVWMYNGSTWVKKGGDGANSSWAAVNSLSSMVADGQYLYAGLESDNYYINEAEVWRYDGSSWTMIGGDYVNSSWPKGNFNYVQSSAIYNGKIYYGLGNYSGMAEVWELSGSTWTHVGGNTANSSWEANTYEIVYSLAADDSYLYAGLGSSQSDANIWRYNGSTWQQIYAGIMKEAVYSMATSGSILYFGLGNTANDSDVYMWDMSSWQLTQIGGNGLNRGWSGADNIETVSTLLVSGSVLYAGLGLSAGDAEVWKYESGEWTKIGGDGVNSGWAAATYEYVTSLATDGTYIYAGLGASAGDAEVWRYTIATGSWGGALIGGDGTGWANATFETVTSMAVSGSTLYAGLGSSTNDAEVRSWDGASWTKIGGDSVNSGWTTSYDDVRSLLVSGDTLYAGLGVTVNEGEVWAWNGSSWTQKGGDGVNGSFDNGYEGITALAINQGNLYAGLGTSTKDAEVWSFNGTVWTKIGGDGLNSGWIDNEYEQISSLIGYNGYLYAGLGNTNAVNDGELWKWDGASWTKIGGDNINSGWGTGAAYETVSALVVYQGKLFAGLGSSVNASNMSDGEVWSYGDNKVLSSDTSSWSADTWYHVAATYDGSTMKLYVNGSENASLAASLTLADGSLPLYIGRHLGNSSSDIIVGTFTGTLDEIRVSNTARSTFYTSPYTSSAVTVRPGTALEDSGVKSWSGFAASETLNGGTATYRLSDDNGTSWKYWNSAWTTSASTANANSYSDIDSHIDDFPVTNDGVLWQAILSGNGDQRVVLNSVQITYIEDTEDPINPAALTVTATCGSRDLSASDSGGWCNSSTPSFSWTGADDGEGSGIEGYWVYFGTSSSANPRTARGLANELGGAGVRFQTGTSLAIGTDTSAISNGATYYLLVLSKDKAENYPDSAWLAFTYKYDVTAPTPPAFISVSPSGYSSSRDFVFLWPSSGSSAASDTGAPTTGSGIASYQYKVGADSGDYVDWSSITSEAQVSLENVAYQEGANTFYLRTIDNAGNNSAEATVSFYYAGSAPTAPTNLIVTPSSSVGSPASENAFALSWSSPSVFNGSIKQYHYSINVLPTSTNTTVTTGTSLGAGPFATQQGKNTFYVVAEDEAGNINYNLYASTDFYAQTAAPGSPTAVQIFDISNRETKEFAVSLKWTEPANKGSGFDGYEIYRSADNVDFVLVGSILGTTFADTGLSSQIYYYYIKAKDNAGQYSVASTTVSITPTGRFTAPPLLVLDPVALPKAFSASVSWETDRESSSFIEYGTTSDKTGKESGGKTIGALEQTEKHSVTVDGLQPDTIYYFRSVWIDSDGNRGESKVMSLKTSPAPAISAVSASNIALASMLITWQTNVAANCTILFGASTAYGGTGNEGSAALASNHSLNLTGLNHSTSYHFKASCTDADGNIFSSDDYVQATLTKPVVSNLRFETVKDAPTSTLRFTWTTNVPATSIVYYQPNSGDSDALSSSSADYLTGHDIQIKDLSDQITYKLWVKSVDQYGNEAASDINTFTTPDDSRPPKIKNLSIEVKSSGYGEIQKAQVVVTWETDEPASSQLEYSQGISGSDYSFRTREDQAYSTSHVVIASELDPSKIYHLRAVSRDRTGNTGSSEDTTVITGKIQRSVIDIIINSLERSLGWMFGIFKSS